MKKLFLTYCLLFVSLFTLASSDRSDSFSTSTTFSDELKARMAEDRFQKLYSAIDFGLDAKPAYAVFRKAYIGYLNLLRTDKLRNKDILTCIDFSLPSVQKRLWVIDLRNKKNLFYDLVAHGKNSGGNIPKKFSNIRHSNMSSLGFYVTAHTYFGKHGLSLRLAGQEAGFNDKAMERAVVMHGADYVNPRIGKSLGRLGRSFGCPAISKAIYKEVITAIAEGSCLFIYSPDLNYLKKSVLLQEATAIEYFLSANVG